MTDLYRFVSLPDNQWAVIQDYVLGKLPSQETTKKSPKKAKEVTTLYDLREFFGIFFFSFFFS